METKGYLTDAKAIAAQKLSVKSLWPNFEHSSSQALWPALSICALAWLQLSFLLSLLAEWNFISI